MSGVGNRGSIPRLMLEGIKNIFGNEAKSYEDFYPKIFNMESSSRAYELDQQMEGYSLPQLKAEGDDIQIDSTRQGFSPKYIHNTWGKAFIWTWEAQQDEQYGILKKGPRALARVMKVGRDIHAHEILNTAFASGSIMPGGDGVQLCSTSHPRGPSGGTFANRLPVDADFSQAALEDMIKLIMRMTDNRGVIMKAMPQKLIGHTDLTFEFIRVLKSELQSDTAENAINAVKGMLPGGTVNTPYLTANTKSWFITTDVPDGLKGFIRHDIDFDQDLAFMSRNKRFLSMMRHSFGYSDPRGIFGSNGQ